MKRITDTSLAASNASAMDLFVVDWRDVWQDADTSEPVGAVFTKPEIVRLILDLAGYTTDRPLLDFTLLEPSCGDGAFLLEVVDRLVRAAGIAAAPVDWKDTRFDSALRAVDISLANVMSARAQAQTWLRARGCDQDRAIQLADTWTVQSDFLLSEFEARFDFVVGNPPYVRIEHLPRRVLSAYRERYETARDRADLYVAFFEQGLQLLKERGVLAFICANRFTKNGYGKSLRAHIAQHYHVRHYVNLEHTQPFVGDVSAYPAIFTLDRAKGQPTKSATIDSLDIDVIDRLRCELLGSDGAASMVSVFDDWYPGGAPWISTSRKSQQHHSALADSHPTLEESAPGTKVGIGVATGADRVFVLPAFDPSIEADRQIPLAMAAGISPEMVIWKGHYLLNPFAATDDGSLVSLSSHPGFAAYLRQHEEVLRARHVGQRNPNGWYRTIDRVWPRLQSEPKLLIPDIQAGGVIGYDSGEFYPHHNLYWITSTSWPLLALQTLLRSSMVTEQVRAHSVQMRGGSLRYQAQTLRRVRVPQLSRLSHDLLARLANAASSREIPLVDELASEAFE